MKVLIVDKVSDVAGEILADAGIEFDEIPSLSEPELIDIVGVYDAIMLRNQTQITSKVIDNATNLKIVGRAGVGVDNIDIEYAAQKGIWVINSPDGNTAATSEHTIAMMLALSRKIPQAYESVKEGLWERSKFMGNELCEKTLGVIGFGKIGARVATIAKAIGMNIVVYDPFANVDEVEKVGTYITDLDCFWSECDYITVHVPKTQKTLGMINNETIRKMKDGVKIINCARGGIAKEADLKEGLKSGKISGVALDVFENEPDVKTSPLFGSDQNVIMVPHLGASTVEAQTKVASDVASQIVDVLNGKQPSTPVNKPCF